MSGQDVGALLSGTAAPAPSVPVAPAAPPAPTAPAPVAPAGDAPPAAEDRNPIPYDRFAEVNRERAELKTQLEAFQAAEAERQRAAMTDLQRAQDDAQKQAQEAAQNSQRAAAAESKLEIWKAAQQAGFRHPDDAVTFLASELSQLDSAEKITARVTKLATDRQDLLGGTATSPTAIGAPAAPSAPSAEVPLDADGKPDYKRGMGQDLLNFIRQQ